MHDIQGQKEGADESLWLKTVWFKKKKRTGRESSSSSQNAIEYHVYRQMSSPPAIFLGGNFAGRRQPEALLGKKQFQEQRQRLPVIARKWISPAVCWQAVRPILLLPLLTSASVSIQLLLLLPRLTLFPPSSAPSTFTSPSTWLFPSSLHLSTPVPLFWQAN